MTFKDCTRLFGLFLGYFEKGQIYMKLIKMKNGFVNADMIESFAIIEHESWYDIVAYAPSYVGDCECYDPGRCEDEEEAWARLEALAKWLTNGEDGIFDIMHIWESDEE